MIKVNLSIYLLQKETHKVPHATNRKQHVGTKIFLSVILGVSIVMRIQMRMIFFLKLVSCFIRINTSARKWSYLMLVFLLTSSDTPTDDDLILFADSYYFFLFEVQVEGYMALNSKEH